MPHEREADVRAVAVQHPRAGADDGLGLLEIAELFDRLAGHDGHRHRVGEHLEEPGVHFLEHDPHRVGVRGLDAVDRPQHVGARVALDREEALDRVLHVGRRQLAPVHGRLRVPANTAAQLEDVCRLVRLRPRLGEVALDRERPRGNRRPRPVPHEPAMRQAQRHVHAVGGGEHRVEQRRVPAADAERSPALGCLRGDAGRSECGAGERQASEGEHVTAGPGHGILLRLTRAGDDDHGRFRRPFYPDSYAAAPQRRARETRGSEAQHLVGLHALGQPLHHHAAERPHVDEGLDGGQGFRGDHDRAGCRELLHPRGDVGRHPHRGVVPAQIAGHGAHDHLAGVDADPDLHVGAMAAAQRARVGRHRLLHAERGPAGPGGMIGPGDGRAEHRHDAVTHHLVHGAAGLVRGGHQSLDHAVEDLSRLVEVAARQELRRAPHVREQDGEIAVLALGRRRRCRMRRGGGESDAPARGLLLERAVDPPEEAFGLLSLLEVVERAEPHGLLGRLPGRIGREQDHVRIGAVRLRRVQDIEADAIRHAQVGDDHVERVGAELAAGRRDAVGLPDEMAAMPQQEREGRSRGGLVVHDQDGGHAFGGFTFGASTEGPEEQQVGRPAG